MQYCFHNQIYEYNEKMNSMNQYFQVAFYFFSSEESLDRVNISRSVESSHSLASQLKEEVNITVTFIMKVFG